MPVTETTESQKETKEKLKKLRRETSVSLDEVENLMKHTYYSQGKDINKGEKLQSLLEEWPFLFQEVRMAAHFHELTVVSLKETFLNSSEDVKDLLLSYFDEKEENLFHYVEETC